MTDHTLDLDQIEKTAKEATPGPWHWMEPGIDYYEVLNDHASVAADIVKRADAAYIATMDPATTLALVARVRDLEADLTTLRDADQDATGRFAASPHLTAKWHPQIRRLMRERDAAVFERTAVQGDLKDESARAHKLEKRVRDLEAQVARVRALHNPASERDPDDPCCPPECTCGHWSVDDCATIKALGEES